MNGIPTSHQRDHGLGGSQTQHKQPGVPVPQHIIEQQNQILEVQKEYYSIGESNFNMVDVS